MEQARIDVAQGELITLRGVERLAYSISETAECIGVSVDTVRKLIADGELKQKKIGRRVVISRDAIQEYLNS